ncbi:Coenzyme A biosynthesis bifunctional protein CoaBC [Planctomycetes bacterium Pla163]|uniref:Coenzyme A biosynthesis bifunctional protein CoaBC n=1 Tax=Rohdeia mirabilis TaxID=2528008 RepID=A0A518D458_9BACT|nr:Coenzyme A biosynthesis bifunctional protein CoaBC [Planctomycetes bacterium Pla163]
MAKKTAKRAAKKAATKKGQEGPPPRRVVVTAGPTREYIDPVRYLSNESSGLMGFEIAKAAAERGDDVVLIAGPVHQPTPDGVTRVDVTSARDMLEALREHFPECDVLIMAAAVADFRPKRRLAGKWRKKDDGTDTATIELVKNPDLLATIARRKGERLVVGFALETGDGVRRALGKMRRKNADFVVLNDASALGATTTSVTVLGRDGSAREIRGRSKSHVARHLVRLERPRTAAAGR